jgi:hypothetical protein
MVCGWNTVTFICTALCLSFLFSLNDERSRRQTECLSRHFGTCRDVPLAIACVHEQIHTYRKNQGAAQAGPG